MMPITEKSAEIIGRVMRWLACISVFGLIMSHTIRAQELSRKDLPDTLHIDHPLNQSLMHSFDTLIALSPSLRKSPIIYSTWYLHQSITNLPSSLSSQFEQQIDIISPWKQELARENELRSLKIILQAVSAGGTAYILYEHIRKYGLE